MNNIHCAMQDPRLLDWLSLLSGGVEVELTVNIDVRTLVTRELGMEDDYLENRIRTVFLDGSPVDDVDEAIVRPGQQLTLCTALPGAMGICMRRNSPLKAYRPGITHCEDCDQLVDPEPGKITLKYFNFIAREQGAKLLAHGVVLPAQTLLDHLGGRDELFWKDLVSVHINKTAVRPEELPVKLADGGEVRLTVTAP